jgi:GTP-binding protein
VEDFRVINAELAAYSGTLAAREQLVVANKIDVPEAAEARARVEAFCRSAGLPFYAVSAATGAGLLDLVRGIAARLEKAAWVPAAS